MIPVIILHNTKLHNTLTNAIGFRYILKTKVFAAVARINCTWSTKVIDAINCAINVRRAHRKLKILSHNYHNIFTCTIPVSMVISTAPNYFLSVPSSDTLVAFPEQASWSLISHEKCLLPYHTMSSIHCDNELHTTRVYLKAPD